MWETEGNHDDSQNSRVKIQSCALQNTRQILSTRLRRLTDGNGSCPVWRNCLNIRTGYRSLCNCVEKCCSRGGLGTWDAGDQYVCYGQAPWQFMCPQTKNPKHHYTPVSVSSIENSTTSLIVCYVNFRTTNVPCLGASSNVVDWGTMLLAGRSRVRFPIRLLDFSIDVILPAALWPWGPLSL
jgi:hypothetical protein